MLPRSSKTDQTQPQQPLKRKSDEYQDPDYANAINHFLNTTKRACVVNEQNISSTSNKNLQPEAECISDENSTKYRRVCKIIEREFQKEINFKLEQLEEIDERLDKALHLLDRLRYAIVADYYSKQTIPLNASDCSTMRGTQTLFDDEPVGPQLALHPSLKKIIGKKPKTFEEILRTCPTRAAAQNAKQTILIKSQTTKKRERILKQLIRDEGIVIDHSKLSSLGPSIDPLSALSIVEQAAVKRVNCLTTKSTLDKVRMPAAPAKSLNATRLNNKAKHLIVVGNTSKYIGADVDEQDQKLTNKTLSHKWLVYVQAKDPTSPLELYVKKVRFFLHNSYRPNNIIDVCSAPFQIARRGWGEFPIRIQLFFKETLQQKPVQLIHNLILDKTLSGLQTLGAETLVEIWLRSDVLEFLKPASTSVNQENIQATTTCDQTSTERNRKISFTQIKEIDDNLFEFLNQIEETPTSLCADIEKIQPTVIVTDPVNNIPNTTCNKVEALNIIEAKSPKKICISNMNSGSRGKIINDSFKPKSNFIAQIESQPKQHSVASIQNGEIQPNTISLEINAEQMKKTVSKPTISANNIKIFSNKKPTIVNNSKLIFPEALNSAKGQNAYPQKILTSTSNQSQLVHSFLPKKVLQKKLVQLVDANGNIKYMQMFVATSTVSLAKTTSTTSKATTTVAGINSNKEASVKIPSLPTVVSPFIVGDATVKKNNEIKTMKLDKVSNLAMSPTITNTKLLPSALPSNSSSQLPTSCPQKNIVFQREGKVYIIDPVQMKLKQQQKKQVSLLKPQVSLLKQQQQQQQTKQQEGQQTKPIIFDHDYVPAPPLPIVKDNNGNTSTKNLLAKTATKNYPCIIKSTPFQAQALRPRIHLGIKHARDSANNALELLHKKRLDFKKDFLQKNFAAIQEAVEYLLRRLPLVATQNYTNLSTVFPFTSKSLENFNSLPAFKQRACEWLRAKFIAKNLKAHTGLYKEDNTNVLWTTKEVAMFARHHAYTPVIKSLKPIIDENSKEFTDLVKNEIKNEQVHHETITSNTNICNWIGSISKNLENQQVAVEEDQSIDILSIDFDADGVNKKCKTNKSPIKYSNTNEMVYLSSPEYLENETKLVREICKQMNLNLQSEEIIDGVIHPMSQTLLASCLRLFIEKLLRYTLAFKVHREQSNITLSNNLMDLVEPHEIGKVIATVRELDFLSNRHLGAVKSPDEFSENK